MGNADSNNYETNEINNSQSPNDTTTPINNQQTLDNNTNDLTNINDVKMSDNITYYQPRSLDSSEEDQDNLKVAPIKQFGHQLAGFKKEFSAILLPVSSTLEVQVHRMNGLADFNIGKSILSFAICCKTPLRSLHSSHGELPREIHDIKLTFMTGMSVQRSRALLYSMRSKLAVFDITRINGLMRNKKINELDRQYLTQTWFIERYRQLLFDELDSMKRQDNLQYELNFHEHKINTLEEWREYNLQRINAKINNSNDEQQKTTIQE